MVPLRHMLSLNDESLWITIQKAFFVIQQPTGSSIDGIVWSTDAIKAFFSCNIGMRCERILVMFYAFWPPCNLIIKQICTKKLVTLQNSSRHTFRTVICCCIMAGCTEKSSLFFPKPQFWDTLTAILKIVLYCCLNIPFLPQCTFKAGFIHVCS